MVSPKNIGNYVSCLYTCFGLCFSIFLTLVAMNKRKFWRCFLNFLFYATLIQLWFLSPKLFYLYVCKNLNMICENNIAWWGGGSTTKKPFQILVMQNDIDDNDQVKQKKSIYYMDRYYSLAILSLNNHTEYLSLYLLLLYWNVCCLVYHWFE